MLNETTDTEVDGSSELVVHAGRLCAHDDHVFGASTWVTRYDLGSGRSAARTSPHTSNRERRVFLDVTKTAAAGVNRLESASRS